LVHENHPERNGVVAILDRGVQPLRDGEKALVTRIPEEVGGFIDVVLMNLDLDVCELDRVHMRNPVLHVERKAERESGFALIQTAERIGQNGGEHGTSEIGQIDGGYAFRERTPEPHGIEPDIDIGDINMDAGSGGGQGFDGKGVVKIGRTFRINGEDMWRRVRLDLVVGILPYLGCIIRQGFGGKRGFRGFVEICDAFVERPAIDLVFVEGVELVDGAEVFAQDAVGVFLGPLIKLEHDVAVLDVFGEPEFLLVRD